ncbi:MAG: filamentous hemagglutinin N-terminal domain-containing protein, partial [Burkholderiales bacterium]|nr:filamentous hemagglutinin N-terminal domain-containing protein [Burkholderiales bacterium]
MAVCGAVAAMTWRQKMLAVAVASCFAADFSSANPTGPTVARGRASFVTQGNVLTVTNAPGTVINWQSFSIPSQDITRFMQQSAASAVLNRVMSGNPSTILGTLQSNGRVYLINPSGITIGPSGVIDVQGFVASTLNISDADFIAGRHRFAETPGAGAVVNEGRITTPSGGTVYLLGQNVENHGVIRTPRGEIVLAAGRSIELVDARTPELRVEIKAPENEALNLGQLIAEGGRIGMYAGLVRHGGVANANTAVVGENGRIVFKAVTDVTLESGSVTSASGPTAGSVKVAAETGKAIVAGAVEARSSTGRGGVVEVSASRAVSVEPSGRISASGAEGGRITLASSGDAVRVAGPVSVDGSAGGGGRIEIRAATRAVVAEGGRVSSAGALLGGTIDLRAAADVVVEAGGTVHADGRSGGAVTVKSAAGPAILDGTITVEGSSGAGGVIEIDAQTDVIVGSAGTLAARGAAGGSTRVEARQGTLLASGAIDAAGTDGPGGRIMLLAPKVGLVGNGRLNASGRTAGGVVLVGGDFQGANAEVPNAERTYVGHDVLIAADAIDSGDGGRVIVWSEQLTGFFGKVTARGGARSGNGGFVEISGKERLVFRGVVDLSAPAGSGGKLLLDPQDLVIEGGTSNAGGTDATDSTLLGTDDSPGQVLFGENSGALTTITEVGLEAIGAGSDVELQAGHSITTSGSFSSGLTFSPNTNVTFRTRNDAGDDAGSLFAAGINLGAVPITLQGTGTLLISTNDSGAGAGSGGSGGTNPSIRLGGISSAGGSVTVGTGGGTGTITLTGNVATTAGSNAGAVTFSGPAVLAANVVVNTNHGSGADGNVTFGGTVNADAAGNNRTLTLNTGAALATLAGAVGGAASLGGLATTGTAAINGGAVTTSGAQNYGGAVTLGAGATVVASTGGNAITFGGTVNGASALTVNTTGATSFG